MKLIALILSLLMLSSTVIPCYAIDNCAQEEHGAQSRDSEEEDDDCTGCSPFSICSAESGFTVSHINPSIEPATLVLKPVSHNPCFSINSEYYSSLFQPPRCR